MPVARPLITAIQKVAAPRPETAISAVHRTVEMAANHAVVHQLASPGEARHGPCADSADHAIRSANAGHPGPAAARHR